MRHILSQDQRENSASSAGSSSRSSMSSLQTYFKKRKRDSSSPSPPPRQDSSKSESTSVDSSGASTRSRRQGFNGSRFFRRINSGRQPCPLHDSLVVHQPQDIQQYNTSLPAAQTQEMGKMERTISNRRPVWTGRRRSSVRLHDFLPPQDFTAKELRKPIELSKPSSLPRIGRVFRPQPEPGIRVETKVHSPESYLLTTRPVYSARQHSPFVTGRSHTTYFESKIRRGCSEDGVHLFLGFAAGRVQASFIPRLERGSVGVCFHDGGLYVGRQLLAKAVCKLRERIGIGITFSKSDASIQEMDGVQSSAVSPPSISVEVFLTRDGKKAGSWNLSELKDAGAHVAEGLEGIHDVYAAIGTLKEVNVDILFDKEDWKYPNAG